MNGMKPGDIIDIIQNKHMVYMDQKDDLVDVKGTNDWIFLANDRETPWKDITTRNYHDSIHMMNKRSLDRNWQKLLGVLDG
jgi:hypothetical protein